MKIRKIIEKNRIRYEIKIDMGNGVFITKIVSEEELKAFKDYLNMILKG